MKPGPIARKFDKDEIARPAAPLARIFEQQRARSRAAPSTPCPERADRLRRLRRLLLAHRGALAAAISADFGQRSLHEAELLEVNPVLDGIGHSLRHGLSWTLPQRRRPGYKFWPGTAWLMPQPLGVAGIVVPWNYPLALSLGPPQCALAAWSASQSRIFSYTWMRDNRSR